MKSSKVQIAIALIVLVVVVGTMATLNSNYRNDNEIVEKVRMESIDPEAVMFNKEDLVEIKDINDPFPYSVKGIIETITTQGKEGEEISFIKLVDSEIYYKFSAEDYETIKSLNIGDTIRIHYENTSEIFKNSDLR